MRSISILGISGSLRKGSYNTSALRAATQLLPANATLKIYDISSLPFFNQDLESEPTQEVKSFKQAITDADVILFSTPEYNYGIPGVLKNAVDVASRPYGQNAWVGKTIGIMSSSPGILGGIKAQLQLRQCFAYCPVLAFPEVIITQAASKFDQNGNLIYAPKNKVLKYYIKRLVAMAEAKNSGSKL